ncbi:MAG: hypothetical protein U0572_12520 [Phycisphaerales bacterium]
MRSRLAAIAIVALVVGCQRAPAPPSGGAATAVTREAESGDARMKVTIDRTKAEAGQPIELVIETSGTSAAPPALPATFGAFDVRPVPQPNRPAAAPNAPRRAVFALSTLESGSVEIPAIELPLAPVEEGKETPKLRTEPIPVEIASLLGGDDDPKHYRDIKGVVDIVAQRDWRTTATIVVAALGAAAVAFALLRMLLRRVRQPAAPLPAHEIALRDLAQLDARDLPAKGKVHEYFVVLTDVVRTYIERRYGIRAPELTTPEFLREARRSSALTDTHQSLLAGFLRGADMVKFGGVRPSAAQCGESMSQARHFVQESAAPPAPESPAAPTDGASRPQEVAA